MSSSEEEFQGDSEEEEEEFVDEDESPAAKSSGGGNDDAEDSDDSDDIPLAALKSPAKKKSAPKKKAAATKKTKKPAKVPAAKKATAAKKKLKKMPITVSTAAGTWYRSASAAFYQSECRKGLLIQRLLCRWWYAIKWPDLSSNEDNTPPPHYDALDGMPGVYIATSGNHVGRILDTRDKEKCPNFQNLAKKSSSELQELLLKALEAQKEALISAEGKGTSTEKELNSLISWAKKVKPDAADKEAIKILKASKLELP